MLVEDFLELSRELLLKFNVIDERSVKRLAREMLEVYNKGINDCLSGNHH